MAASRNRVGPPSLPGIALSFLLTLSFLAPSLFVPLAYAALDPSGLLSTVRSGPLELRVALEDSCFIPGQSARVLICVTNISHDRILFVPEPKSNYSRTDVRLWRVDSTGAWAVVHPSLTVSDVFAVQNWQIPPISPLEASGSTCLSLDLSSFGKITTRMWLTASDRLADDPALSLGHWRLDPGRYSLQVGYEVSGRSNQWRRPVRLESDRIQFRVRGLEPGSREDSLLTAYSRDVNACNFDCVNERSLGWLPRFRGTGLVLDIFMRCGRLMDGVSLDSLFAWTDPRGTRDARRAVSLDLLSRMSGPPERHDPAVLSRYVRGDLARRVVQDRAAQRARFAVRDSIYVERKKYLLRGHPPYGTWHWDWERDPTAQDLR